MGHLLKNEKINHTKKVFTKFKTHYVFGIFNQKRSNLK